MPLFKSSYTKSLESEIASLKNIISNLQTENKNLKRMRRALQSTTAGNTLIKTHLENAKNANPETIARLLFLRDTINQINYRSYILQTTDGSIIIDPEQVPLSRDEEKNLIVKYQAEIDAIKKGIVS